METLTGTLDDMPIWVELRPPDSTGEVAGTYLYIKHRKEIPLSGLRKENVLALKEGEAGKETGEFRLEYISAGDHGPDRWEGAWRKPGGKRTLPVRLVPARAKFKACYLADPDSLVLADGGTLAAEMASHAVSGEDETSSYQAPDGPVGPRYDVTGCSEGLMGATFTWYHSSPNNPIAEHSMRQWTFDLPGKREVDIWKEIDSTENKQFMRFLEGNFMPLFEAMLPGSSDEEEKADSADAKRPAPIRIGNLEDLQVRVLDDKVMIGWLNYFDVSVLESVDRGFDSREVWIEMSPEDRRKFLRKGSALRIPGSKP